MKVAIVILNWNGEEMLKRYLPTVMEYSRRAATVIVADNASTDGSLDFLKKNHLRFWAKKNYKNRQMMAVRKEQHGETTDFI